MTIALADASSSPQRSAGIALMLSGIGVSGGNSVSLRRAMCEPPPANPPALPGLSPARLEWRRMQVRQAFRLALESLLHWIVLRLHNEGPHSSAALANLFHSEVPNRFGEVTAGSWFAHTTYGNPVDAIEAIKKALLAPPSAAQLPTAIADALAFCLKAAPKQHEAFEAADRLPLARARREMLAWKDATVGDFLRHVIESWVLAQHVYWSAGRGLADARAGGKTLLRLRVVLEEAGWSPTPGTKPTAAPNPTADRLETAMSLATECGLVPATAETSALEA